MNATPSPIDAPTFARDAERWEAVASRDARADGTFFYGVRTTGVFCRPSCASRLPRRENVAFFDDADAARAAGFRECKRCRPGGLSLGPAGRSFVRKYPRHSKSSVPNHVRDWACPLTGRWVGWRRL